MIGKETQAPFKFPPLVSGATLKSTQFTITKSGGNINNLADASVIFYKDGMRTLVLTVGSGITIDNAATWTITVGPVAPDLTSLLEAGLHSGELVTIEDDAAATTEKYLFLTLPVLPTAPPA
jgi:hypothetical protein